MLKGNPLEFVKPVDMRRAHQCRRAFSDDEMRQLLSVMPPPCRMACLFAVNTGARRKEIKLLRWSDLELDGPNPFVHFRAEISKHPKDARIPLRADVVAALREFRPVDWAPFQLAFRGCVPKMETYRKYLSRAGIPYLDEIGRKADFHALRVTFGTNLVRAGRSMREVQELMRHSDIRLTMKIYTDVSKLPLRDAVSALPSFSEELKDASGVSSCPLKTGNGWAMESIV